MLYWDYSQLKSSSMPFHCHTRSISWQGPGFHSFFVMHSLVHTTTQLMKSYQTMKLWLISTLILVLMAITTIGDGHRRQGRRGRGLDRCKPFIKGCSFRRHGEVNQVEKKDDLFTINCIYFFFRDLSMSLRTLTRTKSSAPSTCPRTRPTLTWRTPTTRSSSFVL